jgi:hypothetical protein
VDELFFALDQDNDGVVSEPEFLAASALLPFAASSDSDDQDFGQHVDSASSPATASATAAPATAVAAAPASSDEESPLAAAVGSNRLSSIRSLHEIFSDGNGDAKEPCAV